MNFAAYRTSLHDCRAKPEYASTLVMTSYLIFEAPIGMISISPGSTVGTKGEKDREETRNGIGGRDQRKAE